jgi:hypothetical protein
MALAAALSITVLLRAREGGSQHANSGRVYPDELYWPAPARPAVGREGAPMIGRSRLTMPAPESGSDAEQVWNIFQVTSYWVSRADDKAGLILASAGVAGGALFSLMHGRLLSVAVLITGSGCGLFSLAATLCATAALWARLHPRTTDSLIYFQQIARTFPSSAEGYAKSMRDSIRSPETLTTQVISEIWANAHIASRKYRWINVGLACLSGSVLLLGLECALLLS